MNKEIDLVCPSFVRGKKTRRFVEGLLSQIQREQSKVTELRGIIKQHEKFENRISPSFGGPNSPIIVKKIIL